MTVKQLYEILGKYIDVGAGEWGVMSIKRGQFKTRKEHSDWLKSKTSKRSVDTFYVSEVLYFAVIEDDEDHETNCAGLLPSLFIKDENRAFYNLPPEDYVKGKKITRTPKKLELVSKASKGSKKRTKKSARTISDPKKK